MTTTFRATDHPRIVPVAAFNDNYIWLMAGEPGSGGCLVVDPGDAAPVVAAIEARGLALQAILVTHHHGDHVGGVAALKARWPAATVYGPAGSPAAGLDVRLADGERLDIAALGLHARVIAVPGHTLDHIAFACEPFGGDPRPVLVCGDTLFAGGCGRIFEGTPADLHRSLGRLAALDPGSIVYCAHEYTVSNLAFARAAEPANAALAERQREALALRARAIETVPSTIDAELRTNPFLRADRPEIAATVRAAAAAGTIAPGDGDATSPLAVFAALRQWKNVFRA